MGVGFKFESKPRGNQVTGGVELDPSQMWFCGFMDLGIEETGYSSAKDPQFHSQTQVNQTQPWDFLFEAILGLWKP